MEIRPVKLRHVFLTVFALQLAVRHVLSEKPECGPRPLILESTPDTRPTLVLERPLTDVPLSSLLQAGSPVLVLPPAILHRDAQALRDLLRAGVVVAPRAGDGRIYHSLVSSYPMVVVGRPLFPYYLSLSATKDLQGSNRLIDAQADAWLISNVNASSFSSSLSSDSTLASPSPLPSLPLSIDDRLCAYKFLRCEFVSNGELLSSTCRALQIAHQTSDPSAPSLSPWELPSLLPQTSRRSLDAERKAVSANISFVDQNRDRVEAAYYVLQNYAVGSPMPVREVLAVLYSLEADHFEKGPEYAAKLVRSALKEEYNKLQAIRTLLLIVRIFFLLFGLALLVNCIIGFLQLGHGKGTGGLKSTPVRRPYAVKRCIPTDSRRISTASAASIQKYISSRIHSFSKAS